MLVLTLYTKDETCLDIVKVELGHASMFNQDKLELHFISEKEQIRLIESLIKHHVLFECQGKNVFINTKEHLRVRYRIDAKRQITF